jgi:hypothetical protein
VLDRGAQAAARGTATLSQLEKNNSADFQPSKVNLTDFFCAVARYPSRRYTIGEFEPLAVASRRCWRMFQPL